jgi:exo-1,4-beta-D-glucosaminidase
LRSWLFAVLLFCPLLLIAEPEPDALALKTGWQIQSGCKLTATGDAISRPEFRPGGWFQAIVPGGVLANLVADHVYPSPYEGMNLRQIPGTTYPIGTIFANRPMPDDSPFKCAWWYRVEFDNPHPGQNRARVGHPEQAWLHFDGINYRASIWLNGKRIADAQQVAGAWRLFEFNVTDALVPGRNVLAVEVAAPTETDLGINWVDWNPAPPDKNMGLWRDVWLSFSGPVALRHPQVLSDLDIPSLSSARLTITAEVRNATPQAVRGVLRASVENVHVSQPVELAAGETRIVSFTPEQFPQLALKNPRVWWPAPLGPQSLYTAALEFESAGGVSDAARVTFGIRKVTSELNDKGYRQFKINGRNILIRGAGWAPDLLLNASPQRLEQELRYVRHMNLNAVRLEGKLETDHFFDVADRMGILIMAGWCCCDQWEKWDKWTAENRVVANESLRSQMLRLRNHPSVFVWLNGSDNPPPADVEKGYLDIETELRWPNPIVSSATAKAAASGPSGVKMTGPYEYVPPSYWLADTGQHGGAWGFNTETSPGPAVPPVEGLRRFLGTEHMWPIDQVWSFHCGSGKFKTLDVFTAAMDARYGHAGSVEDFARKAQALTYEGERAMFEAYGRNKYTSTGVIQWMLNNAWPSMIWHLYDWYLMPGGGYFGARKANEPLHVQYSYDDGSVAVVNSLYQAQRGLKVAVSVYSLDMTLKYAREVPVDVSEDGVTRALTIPAIDGLSTTYFVRLALSDAGGRLLSSNFYWLSTKPDVLDWAHTNYYVTPTTQQADFTGLNTLPLVELQSSASTRSEGGEKVTRVELHNPTHSLAFLVRLRLTDRAGHDVLPVLWDDNFIALMPGERREITARYDARQFAGTPQIHLEGWNIMPKEFTSR